MLWENFAVLDALRRSNHEERKRHRQYAHKCRTERVTKVLRLDGKSFEGQLRDDEGDFFRSAVDFLLTYDSS